MLQNTLPRNKQTKKDTTIWNQETTIKTFKDKFFKFLSFINLPWGHARSQKKFGPNRLSRFDVYWIQTNKHPDRQAESVISFLITRITKFEFSC